MTQAPEILPAAGEAGAPRMSWIRALALSCLAVYGPFLAMAIGAQVFLTCPHCKGAVWTLLLPGPALVVMAVAQHWLHLPKMPNPLPLALAVVLVGAGIVLAAALARRGRRWSVWVLSATTIVASAMAFLLLAFIRA